MPRFPPISRRQLLALASGLVIHLGASDMAGAGEQARAAAPQKHSPAAANRTRDMPPADDPFGARLAALVTSLVDELSAFDAMLRHLHPPEIPALRAALQPRADALRAALARFRAEPPPSEFADVSPQLVRAATTADRALRFFATGNSPDEAIPHVLSALHEHSRAQALLYPLHTAFPPVDAYFLEPAVRVRAGEPDPSPHAGLPTGVIIVRADGVRRGDFALYVPEDYDPARRWPLVVALHGGGGRGEDFLWAWLVEARSRGFLLLAPSSIGPTWSMQGEDVDAASLQAALAYVQERWPVDPNHILLTGLSDGATYTLLRGLQPDAPFTALAPMSGVLHPAIRDNGGLTRANGKRIYLVHGARDWMFPIPLARATYEVLRRAGADITFREIADLSHTYARDENARILEWFDPDLRLRVAR